MLKLFQSFLYRYQTVISVYFSILKHFTVLKDNRTFCPKIFLLVGLTTFCHSHKQKCGKFNACYLF